MEQIFYDIIPDFILSIKNMKDSLEKRAVQLVCVVNSMNEDHKITVKIIGLHHGVSDYL